MAVPSIVQLRDQLGRALVQQPDSPTLHSANRVLNAVFSARDKLPSRLKLAAARAAALALDLASTRTLSSGQARPLLSDFLNPDREPSLAWARTNVAGAVYTNTGKPVKVDPLANLNLLIERAQQSLRDAPGQAALDVANALDEAYQAVADSAKNVGRAAADTLDAAARSAVLPVALGVCALLAVGYARRGGRTA